MDFSQGPIGGEVAPGFESVRVLYERETQSMAELNTQLCVYHQGEKVVDLWRSAASDATFSPDSLVNVFSSGKSLETIAIASLVDRGLLDYGDRIDQHWPEFAARGKVDITVADLMRHEAGMAAFDASLDPADLLRENLKKNRVGVVVEKQAARFRTGAGNQREYHAITRGWIANELFRRVDPAGRTMGEYLRDDISRPLGADVMIGVERADLSRVSRVVMPSLLRQLFMSLRPRALGRRIKLGFLKLLGRILRILFSGRGSTIRKAPPPFSIRDAIAEVFNDPVVSAGETPSAGAKCSARGLARIAAMMSARGHWGGVDYLGRDAWDALHAHPVEADMTFAPTDFTQGGVHRFRREGTGSDLGRALNAGREGFYGWMGFGGSIFQWHPGHEIGFAFVPTSLHAVDLCNERGKVYQTEVLRCVEAMSA